MNEKTFIEIMNENNSYNIKLDKILSESNSIINEICYIIDENWYKELSQNFNRYKNTKNILNGIEFFKLINIPKRTPNFINNFSEFIENLKNNIEFKLVSKKLMEIIYEKEYLNKFNYVKCYGKNNKLIIEYEIKDENKPLLIVDPFKLVKREIFIIIINDIEKNKLYENILSVQYIMNDDISKKNKNIIPFDEYVKGKKIFSPLFETKDKGNENIEELYREQILRILVKIFFYEKNIIKNGFEKEKKIYYLINPEWMNKYKKHYKYKEISKLLEEIYNNNSNEKINNIIINKCFEKFKFQKFLSNNFNEINPLIENNFDIEFIKQCSIIPQNIFDLIRYLIFQNEELKIKKAKVLVKNEFIYLFHSLNIEIGKINNELIFNPIYIFKYNSKEIYQIEKKNISKYEITDYIAFRNCQENNYNLQELINNYNKNIGHLIILKDIYNKVRGKSKRNTKKEEINKKNNNFHNNIKINNYNEESPKSIKLNKNNNLNIRTNNLYENFINNKKNIQNLVNHFNINIKSDENNFEEEPQIKLNDNFFHNAPFTEENIREELYNLEETVNNRQNDNKDEKYENTEKVSSNEIKIIEENKCLNKEKLNNSEEKVNNILIKNKDSISENIEKKNINKNMVKDELNNLYERINDNLIKNKDETPENIEKEINYQNQVKERNIYQKKEELKKENEKLKLLKKNNENKLKDIKNKIEEYKLLKKCFEENEIFKKNYDSKISLLKEKENNLKINYEYYSKENGKIKKENEIINKENQEKESQIKNKKKEYSEIKKEIEKQTKNYDQLMKDKELKNNNIDKTQKYRNDEYKIIGNKEEEEQINDILKNKPIISYDSPTLIGLNNIGATCFMNATLQCLSQTGDLTNYFLCQKNISKIINNNIALKNKNDLQLSPSYFNLIQKLWDENNAKSSFSPNDFRNMVEQLNPLFKSGQPGDSKDFIIFILEQIHKELKEPIKKMLNNQNTPNFLNQYDRNSSFNYFFNEFAKECSVISDIFFGVNETTNICLNCQNYFNLNGLNCPICYNYGIFNCLIFPLEEVRNMKNNNSVQMNNFFQMANEVTLQDCFIYNQKSEVFTGENRNYCNICKQLFDSIYTSKISITPNVLILILNRGRGNIYNVKLNFTEKIDITQFVLQKEKPQILYELYGVITHIGQSGPNAHFVASCKSPVDFKWYRYNDAFVNPITNLQKEVIDFGTPYILFYQKV